MPDQPSPKTYGRLKLYALSASGLHRATGDGAAGSWSASSILSATLEY